MSTLPGQGAGCPGRLFDAAQSAATIRRNALSALALFGFLGPVPGGAVAAIGQRVSSE